MCKGEKSCDCGCKDQYNLDLGIPLTFGDGGYISKKLVQDLDQRLIKQFPNDPQARQAMRDQAMGVIRQMAYGGLTNKESGSQKLDYNPNFSVSNNLYDQGLSTSQVDTSIMEGTRKEKIKDFARTGTQAAIGAVTGVVDAAGSMAGIDTEPLTGKLSNLKFGEMTSSDLEKQQRAGQIGQTAGATAATIAGGIATGGNPMIISRGADQAFQELGQVDPNSSTLKTISGAGRVGSQLYGAVASAGTTGGFSPEQLEQGTNFLNTKETQDLSKYLQATQGMSAATSLANGGPTGGPGDPPSSRQKLPTLYVDRNDPEGQARHQAYQDSLLLHNDTRGKIKGLQDAKTSAEWRSLDPDAFDPSSKRYKEHVAARKRLDSPEPAARFDKDFSDSRYFSVEYHEPVQPVKYGINYIPSLAPRENSLPQGNLATPNLPRAYRFDNQPYYTTDNKGNKVLIGMDVWDEKTKSWKRREVTPEEIQYYSPRIKDLGSVKFQSGGELPPANTSPNLTALAQANPDNNYFNNINLGPAGASSNAYVEDAIRFYYDNGQTRFAVQTGQDKRGNPLYTTTDLPGLERTVNSIEDENLRMAALGNMPGPISFNKGNAELNLSPSAKRSLGKESYFDGQDIGSFGALMGPMNPLDVDPKTLKMQPISTVKVGPTFPGTKPNCAPDNKGRVPRSCRLNENSWANGGPTDPPKLTSSDFDYTTDRSRGNARFFSDPVTGEPVPLVNLPEVEIVETRNRDENGNIIFSGPEARGNYFAYKNLGEQGLRDMQAMRSGIRQTTGEFANNFLMPPAMVASTVLGGAPLVGPAARGVSFMNTALQAPMQFGSRAIPGLTGYNLLGAFGAGESINQFANPRSTTRQSIGRAIQDPTASNILDASGNTLAAGLGFVGIGAAKALTPQLTRGARQLTRGVNPPQESIPQSIPQSSKGVNNAVNRSQNARNLNKLLTEGKASLLTEQEFKQLQSRLSKNTQKLDVELGDYSQADQEKAFQEGTEFATKWAYDPIKLDNINREKARLLKLALNHPHGSPERLQVFNEYSKLSQADAFNQRFKDKVSDIFRTAQTVEPNDPGFTKNKDYLVSVDPNDPVFQSLPFADQKYVLDNYKNIRGARTGQSTITLRKEPYETEFVRVETKKPFDIKDPKTWLGRALGEPELYEINYSRMEDPEIIRGVAAHEVGHDLQGYKNWVDLLRHYDPNFGYYTGHERNPLAKRVKDALVDPVKPKGTNRYEDETWLSAYSELHSEIMKAREKFANSYIKRGNASSIDEAIDYIKSRSDDDDFIDLLIEQGNLEKHFKPTTTKEEKRFLVKIAPALIPTVLGLGAGAAAVAGSEPKQIIPPNFKYGGGLRRWFKEDWTDVKTGEPCGRESASDSSRPYPYCRPKTVVSSQTPATTKHPEAKSRAKAKTGPAKVTPIKRR